MSLIPKRIAGANAYPGAPKGWDPSKDGKCSHLAVRVRMNGDRVGWCESAWEVLPRDLDALARGGQLVLRVIGWQVPVALYVETNPTECQPYPREKICSGDGAECERLFGLGVGHLLTESDVRDISNVISDLNDEIGQSAEIFHRGRILGMNEVAPEKGELIEKIDQLQAELAAARAILKAREAKDGGTA